MDQLVSAPPPDGSFGALLRACRHQALLSQEQLAARAGLSERTVRELEAGRVRSPRADTVRLLADALQLAGPQRESWFAAARWVNHQRAGPAAPGARSPAQVPSDPPPSRPGPDAGTRNDGRLTRAERRELAKLRGENRRLREDVETLKRATAIIASLTR